MNTKSTFKAILTLGTTLMLGSSGWTTEEFGVFHDQNILKVHLFDTVPADVVRKNAGAFHVVYELDHKHFFRDWKKEQIVSYQSGIDESTLTAYWGTTQVHPGTKYHFPFLSLTFDEDGKKYTLGKRSSFAASRPLVTLCLEMDSSRIGKADVESIAGVYRIFSEIYNGGSAPLSQVVLVDRFVRASSNVSHTTLYFSNGKYISVKKKDFDLVDTLKVMISSQKPESAPGESSGDKGVTDSKTKINDIAENLYLKHFWFESALFVDFQKRINLFLGGTGGIGIFANAVRSTTFDEFQSFLKSLDKMDLIGLCCNLGIYNIFSEAFKLRLESFKEKVVKKLVKDKCDESDEKKIRAETIRMLSEESGYGDYNKGFWSDSTTFIWKHPLEFCCLVYFGYSVGSKFITKGKKS
jgi:hypothetical protein